MTGDVGCWPILLQKYFGVLNEVISAVKTARMTRTGHGKSPRLGDGLRADPYPAA
jgi:hypothetical protein